MSQEFTVRKTITINAPAKDVWEVLTMPEFIRQWDDVPQDFKEKQVQLGSLLRWNMPGDKYTELKVIEFEGNKLLKLSLYNSTWPIRPDPQAVTYTYRVEDIEKHCLLTIEIGDFAFLSNSEDYFEASMEFAEEAAMKIKDLAEKKELAL